MRDVTRLSLELNKKKHARATQLVHEFFEAPDRFLGTTLLGFTLFLVLLSLQLSRVMQLLWQRFEIGNDFIRVLVEIALATGIVLILAEFIPRALFRARSTTLLVWLAPVCWIFYKLFYPIATALMDAAEWVLKYIFNLRLHPQKGSLRREDLQFLFKGKEEEERQERSAQLLENAQELPKIRVRQ